MKAAIAVLAIALLGAGCYGLALVNWGAVWRWAGHATDCPEGQHLDITGWMPVFNGKTTVITPVYGCVTS
jgi:hypothetical protein